MNIISIAIQKGGSGKTTTAFNLGAALQQRGRRVLLVDLDPQANLTQAMGILEEPDPSIYALLKAAALGQDTDLGRIRCTANSLDLLPAALDLADAELELVSVYGREKLLDQVLRPAQAHYDLVLIDCPPSIGMLTINALTASDYVLMPLQAEYLPLKGVASFMHTFTRVQTRLNARLALLGMVLTRFDPRKIMNRSVLDQLVAEHGALVFDTRIRTNIALATAQERGLDIFSYKARTHGAEDYNRLAEEVLRRIE